jgi:hypothetical protein
MGNQINLDFSRTPSLVDSGKKTERITSEQKEFVGHGNFLSWLSSNIDISERTAQNYMSLFTYRDKTANIADLHTAYNQIETLQAQEKMSREERDRNMIVEFRRTGIPPLGWNKALEDRMKRSDENYEHNKQIREQEQVDRERRVKEAKEQEDTPFKYKIDSTFGDAFKTAADTVIAKSKEREDWKEKIRLSDGGKEDAFMDAIIDYLETLSDDNRRIEACNNIIKICRNISVELQKTKN